MLQLGSASGGYSYIEISRYQFARQERKSDLTENGNTLEGPALLRSAIIVVLVRFATLVVESVSYEYT